MIQKHVDLIAIALLLAAVSFCTHTRNAFALGMRSARTVWLKPYYQSPHVSLPLRPHIPFSRD